MLNKVLFVIVVFLANVIQTLTGFAGTVIAMPFSILLVGKAYAKPLLNIVGLFVCLVIAIKNYKLIKWKYVLVLSIFMGIGMVIGLFLERYFYSELFLLIYGAIICLISIYFFFVKNPIELPKWLNFIIMICAGVIHAIFVSGGPLLIIVTKGKLKDKNEFRATLAVCWVILNSILLTTDLSSHAINLEQFYMLLIIIPTVVISILLGKVILKHVSNELFMKITCVLLFISGISIIV